MKRTTLTIVVAGCLVMLLAAAPPAGAQTFGTVRGTILDQSEAIIPNATVEIQNPVAHYMQTTKTTGDGKFEFDNVPFNNYHLTASVSGFQASNQDIDVRSAIPLEVKLALMVGTATTEIQVQEEVIEGAPPAEYGDKTSLVVVVTTRSGLGAMQTHGNVTRPRHLFDLAAGIDNLFKGDRNKWSVRVEAVNVANKVALYNFLATFSGTHYVTPRTVSGTLAFHF